jgi:hypothetical protein
VGKKVVLRLPFILDQGGKVREESGSSEDEKKRGRKTSERLTHAEAKRVGVKRDGLFEHRALVF